MARSTFVTATIARFDVLTTVVGPHDQASVGEPLMWAVGADEGAAGQDFGTQLAHSWLALGLHATSQSADALFDAGIAATPFFSGAAEMWSAVLQPFAHHGAVNWLDPSTPGLVFEPGPKPRDNEPFVVITSAGWTLDDRFDVDKALDFGRGVAAVRRSMDGVDGLIFQHGFNFPGLLAVDGPTVTMWRDDAATRAFAYRPGTHKTEMDRFRANDTADRSSFTRLRVLRARGAVQRYSPDVAVSASE
jgi:hypothetical protein